MKNKSKAQKKRAKKQNPLEKLKKNPYSLRLAINAKCYECNGRENWTKRTKYCQVFDCPLWHVRPHSKGITKNDCKNYQSA